MALAHQQMEPQEVVFFGVAALTSYCYTMAPNDDVAQRTIDAAVETGKEDYES